VKEFDVAIIGAGIIGSFIARELSRYELRIGLFDKEPFPGVAVTKAGVSLIHSPLMCPPGTLKGKLSMGAPERYKKLAGELDVPFREVDELFVALHESQMANLEALRKRAKEYGLKDCELIGPERVRTLEPHVSEKVKGALYVRGLLAVYPPEWAFALCENAQTNGAELHLREKVTGLSKKEGFGYEVRTERDLFSARFLVNAAGLYADEIGAMLGDGDIELRLTKGTMAILDKSLGHLVRHTIYGTFSGEHSQLVTPTAHGNLMIGLGRFPTPRDKQDTYVTRDKLEEVIRMSQELVPALSEKGIIATFAGIRSENNKAPNGDFYIELSEKAKGVVHAVIGSPGLTAAPAVAELVIKKLQEAGLRLREKKAFQKERKGWFRFAEAPEEARRKVVANDLRYGRLVCRCEAVSEGEIIEAIARGADTLDSVKHVTRAGMGRCQGGYCAMAVLDLLAKERGGQTQVTKKGDRSSMVFGLDPCSARRR